MKKLLLLLSSIMISTLDRDKEFELDNDLAILAYHRTGDNSSDISSIDISEDYEQGDYKGRDLIVFLKIG